MGHFLPGLYFRTKRGLADGSDLGWLGWSGACNCGVHTRRGCAYGSEAASDSKGGHHSFRSGCFLHIAWFYHKTGQVRSGMVGSATLMLVTVTVLARDVWPGKKKP
jgi:hypothetical protein